MATLTTSYKLLGSVKTSTYSQLRLYGKYNSQSTDNNTSSVSLQLRLYGNGGSGSFSSGTAKISGTSYSLGNTSYSKNAEKTLCTKTYTATHSSDGTYTASISYSITSTGTVSGSSSASITLPQIKRTSVLGNISDFTFGNSIPITYTEYVSSYTANLKVLIGSTTVKTINNISSGTSISFTSSELNTIYGLVPNATTTSVTFQLVTMNGSTQIGTNSKSATGTIPSSVKPTISSVVLEDSLGYRQQIGNYVQSKSKIHGTISSSGGTGSGISSIETQINGETIYGNNFYTKELATSGTNSYTVRVTDTRGRSATYTGSFSVISYSAPTINFNVYRSNSSGNQDDNGNYICINVNASIDSLNNENSKEFKIEYRQGGGSWTTLTTYNTSYNYVLTNSVYSGFSSSYPFDVKITATDTFGSEYAQIWIPTAKTVLDFYHDGTGVAIGKVADTPNKFEVAYDTEINGELVVDSIRSKNMFDKGNITTGLTYTSTGTTTGLTNSFVQYTYIPVKPNTKYTIGTTTDYTSETDYRLQILEYNSSKAFIQRNMGFLSKTYTITTTANTYFVRLGASTITKDQLQFEESNTQTTYAPYQNLTGQEIYSTGETIIGTWINGKPLYRKVLTTNSLANNGALTIYHNIQNLEKVTKVSYSWYDTNDKKWYEGIRWDSASIYIKSDGVNSTRVLISCFGTNWSTRTQDVSVVLEYTKSTD